ncbi:hypothetical protein OSB04_009038 [Centaurea solstitialis]|uniref:Uncharacterized protein n=1 Tax=Centaurea solstitialis TaxID=347529 RepID=A0AA38TMX8_9ASTR|nr:hypothetical protein OSB04_009038 [Centaurea solstitialis]
MGSIRDMPFTVKVIEKVVVAAEEPWDDYWLSFTNLDLVVPAFDAASFFCYKKPSHGSSSSFTTMLNTLKASLSRALAFYHPLAGEIAWNAAARENQIHCNNQGVDFTHAVADVQLKELDFYNPDVSIEGKLVPERLRGVLAVQVTELKCGGMVIGCMFDHKAADGYSANMFISSWAEMARSQIPSMLPSYSRSILKPRSPPTYRSSPSMDDFVATFEPSFMPPNNDKNHNDGSDDLLINRIYYIKGEQINKIQQLASENGSKRSKFEAFTSFLWKTFGMSLEKLGNHSEKYCNVAIAVDGRQRLSEGDGEQIEKLMASHFGNVLSLPFGGKGPQELAEMSLSNIAMEVHELLQIVKGKEHFLDIINWVEERRSHVLIPRPFINKDMTVIVSSGQRFQFMNDMDFGWGKVSFGSCYIPPTRKDCYVMTLPGPITNSDDWVVYMHLPIKHINYIEAHASHMFKPVIEKVVVAAEEPWNDRWLPFTNLDFVLPSFEAASFFCYKKPLLPSHGSSSSSSFTTMLNTLKASLSRALALYYPLAGEIAWNEAAGENQIHCNNQGIDFTHAVADVQLKELDFYDPDVSIEGKLVPKKLRGVLAVQKE